MPASRLQPIANYRILFAIAIVVAIIYIHRGLLEPVEYDGYWHVWVATQSNWHQFRLEYEGTSHPPLFFLLLKGVLQLAHGPLAYRAISIAAMTVSTVLLGRTAQRITGSVAAGALAAVVFGMSQPAIVIATEVRSYALALFFIVWAFDYCLRFWISTTRPAREIPWFAVLSALALATHYFAAFFIAASVMAPLLAALVSPSFRLSLRSVLARSWRALAIAYGSLGAFSVFLYVVQARAWAVALSHLPQFYYNAAGGESRLAFLWRNTRNLFTLFLPGPVQSDVLFVLIFTAVLTLLALAAYQIRKSISGSGAVALAPAFLVVLVAELALAGLTGKYPFGGSMRQQSVIFPFLALSAATLSAGILRAQPGVAAALIAVCAVYAIGVEASANYDLIPEPGRYAQVYEHHFPPPAAVLTDKYSFMLYFAGHDAASWTYTGDRGALYIYRTGGPLVARDLGRWNFDFRDSGVYQEAQDLIRSTGVRSVDLFCARQIPFDGGDVAAIIRSTAAPYGLTVGKIWLDGSNVYASLVPL